MNSLIEKLKEITKQTKEQQNLEKEETQKKLRAQGVETIRSHMIQLIQEWVTEEKMMEFAKSARRRYPIMFVSENHVVKNKKTGYKFNVGAQGQILFEELEKLNFEPTVIKIFDWEITERMPHNPDWKPYDKELVSKPGWYISIEW